MRKELLEFYLRGFCDELVGLRTVGREMELLTVYEDGQRAIFLPALERLAEDPEAAATYDKKYNVISEVNFSRKGVIQTDAGKGVPEISTQPEDDLFHLQRTTNTLLSKMLSVTDEMNISVLGLGYHPIQHADLAEWSRKERYDFLRKPLPDGVLEAAVTASDQMHVQITRDEIVPVTNALNGATGAIIAMMANSPLSEGRLNGMACKRELFWDTFGADRCGLGIKFDSIEHFVSWVCERKMLFDRKKTGEYETVSPASFREHHRKKTKKIVRRGDREAVFRRSIKQHDACIWLCTKPRFCYSTVELRSACQQPPHEQMVNQALSLGLVENHRELLKLVESFGWDDLIKFRYNACHDGMQAKLRDSQDMAFGFIMGVLDIAQEGLEQRGLGEEIFLIPLTKRLEERKSPADYTKEVFLQGGMGAVVEYLSFTQEDLRHSDIALNL